MVRGGTTGDAKRSDVQIGPRGSLPWLDDVDPQSGGLRKYAGWMVAVALLVIGGAYLVAVQGLRRPASPSPQETTVPLAPESVTAVPPPVAASPSGRRPGARAGTGHGSGNRGAAAPRSKPSRAAPVAPAATAAPQAASAKSPAAAATPTAAAAAKAQPGARPAAKATVAHVPSPGARPAPIFPLANGAVAGAETRLPRPGAGSQATGQVVQLGAFPTVEQAKPVWRAMERSFPPLRQFSASLIQNRDWNGHAFYQFEIGTASQADSVMLCQSMQKLNFRCAVAGRP
jgi:hypothetical protein